MSKRRIPKVSPNLRAAALAREPLDGAGAESLVTALEEAERERDELREHLRLALAAPTLEAAVAGATIMQALAQLARYPERHELAKAAAKALDALKSHGGDARADEIAGAVARARASDACSVSRRAGP